MQLVPDCSYTAEDAHADMGAAVAAMEHALLDLDVVYRDWRDNVLPGRNVIDPATAADLARIRSDVYRVINDLTVTTTRYGLRVLAARRRPTPETAA